MVTEIILLNRDITWTKTGCKAYTLKNVSNTNSSVTVAIINGTVFDEAYVIAHNEEQEVELPEDGLYSVTYTLISEEVVTGILLETCGFDECYKTMVQQLYCKDGYVHDPCDTEDEAKVRARKLTKLIEMQALMMIIWSYVYRYRVLFVGDFGEYDETDLVYYEADMRKLFTQLNTYVASCGFDCDEEESTNDCGSC